MINNDELEQSYAYCRELAKNNSSFYLGISFSKNKNKRDALFAIYAWLHTVDEYADNTNYSPGERVDQLREFFNKTLKIIEHDSNNITDQFWPAFKKTIITYQIPVDYLEGMIAGQQQDLIKDNYQNFDELYQYCRMVASMVGLMCVCIWGHTTEADPIKVKLLAEQAGIALQLTNILRDVRNDLSLNRVYIPADFAGVERLTSRNFSTISQDSLMKAINTLINKTQLYYDQSVSLSQLIHPDSRLCFRLLMSIYYEIFNKIKHHPELVLSESKISISKTEKLFVLSKTMISYYLGY